MTKINYLPNESVIMKSNDVYRDGFKSTFSDELILTNLNIIYISKRTFGRNRDVIRFPVNQIKLYNGKPQVNYGERSNGGSQLEIYFQNGYEYFVFREYDKNEIFLWINAIHLLTTGKKLSRKELLAAATSASAIPGTQFIAETLKSTYDTFKTTFQGKSQSENRKSVETTRKCISCSAPLTGLSGRTQRCKYCDTEQVL